jgi:hypothetical protein
MRGRFATAGSGTRSLPVGPHQRSDDLPGVVERRAFFWRVAPRQRRLLGCHELPPVRRDRGWTRSTAFTREPLSHYLPLMPRRPRKPKQEDSNEAAFRVVREARKLEKPVNESDFKWATPIEEESPPPRSRNPTKKD